MNRALPIAALLAGLPVVAASETSGIGAPVHLPAHPEGHQTVITPVTTATGNSIYIVEEIPDHSGPDGEVVAMFRLWPNMTGLPDIEATGPDRFSIFSGCDTCGRDAVVLEYKAARRDGEWLLAGFERTDTDRIQASLRVCDVNLLTGRVEIKGDSTDWVPQRLTTTARAIPLSSLTGDYFVEECAAR